MSSAPEITVKEDTSEEVLFDLLRMEALDGTHAMKHKAEGNPDSCHICVKLRNQMKFYADQATVLSSVGELVERTAKTMARQNAGIKWHMEGSISFEGYWELVLTTSVRNEYRRKAQEIVYDLFGSELKFWSV